MYYKGKVKSVNVFALGESFLVLVAFNKKCGIERLCMVCIQVLVYNVETKINTSHDLSINRHLEIKYTDSHTPLCYFNANWILKLIALNESSMTW